MVRKIRSIFVLLIVTALLLSCTPFVFAATTDITYKEYLEMSTQEQLAFREQFSSNAQFKQWYLTAKQEYEDSQNKVVIGDGNSIDLGQILNPAIASGTCGTGLSWSLNSKGILTISGNGAISSYAQNSAPWSEYADQIIKVELPAGLTTIGSNAFYGCANITDVYYADTVNRWNNVTVSSGNAPLSSATLHCVAPVLTQVKVLTAPSKTVYKIGETINTSGLVLKLIYNDDSTEELLAGFQVSQPDTSTVGTKEVTVTYLNHTATFNITVIASPTAISVFTNPNKTNYWVGEEFDPTGLSLKVTYNDGSSNVISDGFTTYGFDSETAGTKTIVVTFESFSTSFDVLVSDITADSIAVLTPPDKTVYWTGEELSTAGLSLNVTYSNGSSSTITDGFVVTGFDSAAEGIVTVTVSYEGCTATFDVVISNDGRCGDTLSWTIVEGVLTISGSGDMYDYTLGSAPWYGQEITDVVIDPQVTHIGNYAFANMPCLTEFAIGDSVTIGVGAFAYCRNLTVLSVSADHPLYYTDANGALYSKDKTVLMQAPGAWVGTFNVPNTVTEIAESAFAGCHSLTNVRYDGSSSATGGYTERDEAGSAQTSNTVSFGKNNITKIGKNAFAGCVSLTSMTLPTNITAISEGTFQNCHALTSVSISANVTSIGNNAFANCGKLASVEYTGRETNWNAIAVGENNEALTGASDITYAGEVRVSGATLALQHNIAVHYKVKKATVETYGFSDLELVVAFNGNSITITEYVESGDEYIFYFNNIAPNQMNDTLVCTLYASRNGKTYASAEREYSVATYCYTQLGRYTSDAYAEFRTLLVDLLNYGAVSQQYTSYNTANLVNADLTETQRGWATQTDRTYNNVQNAKYQVIDNPTVSWKGGGLMLTDSVTMRFKFETADLEGLTFKIEADGNEWIITDVSIEGGVYYIYFNGLNAGQMSSNVYVTAYRDGVAASNTILYSIESYASRNVTATSPAYLGELVDAMMKYGDSAYAYIN